MVDAFSNKGSIEKDEFPHIFHLPNEIILQIFSHLSNPSDWLACSCVCSTWLALTESYICDASKIVIGVPPNTCTTVLSSTYRKYMHWHFKNVEINLREGEFSKLWPTMAPHVRSIRLEEVTLQEKDFTLLLAPCTALQTLEMVEMNSAFLIGNMLSDAVGSKVVRKSLYGVQHFELQLQKHASDAILHDLRSMLPSLTSLKLPSNNISYSKAIYKRFYPAKVGSVASEHVLTFIHVLSWVTQMTSSLRRLDLSHTLFDTTAMGDLAAIKNLSLKSLSLAYCDQITDATMAVLCNDSTPFRLTLAELDVSGCYRITTAGVKMVSASLPGLTKLSIRECRAVLADSLSEVIHNCPIEDLDIGCTDSSSDCALLQPFHRHQPSLSKISLAHVSIDAKHIVMLGAGAPNLTYLNLTASPHAVRDPTLMMLSSLLPRLKHLILAGCCLLTDFGLLGLTDSEAVRLMDEEEQDQNVDEFGHRQFRGLRWANPPKRPQLFSRRVICKNHPRCVDFYNYGTWDDLTDGIYHESRLIAPPPEPVEGEKTKPEDKYQYLRQLDTITPSNISKLQELRELNLSGVFKLTDCSLSSVFNFKELVVLNLSQCPQITITGLSAMASKCPAIEELRLARCEGVCDMAVLSLVHHLNRLRVLDVQYCHKLTSDSLDSISSCTGLRLLDISHCAHIGWQAIEDITVLLPHLRLVTDNTCYREDRPDVLKQKAPRKPAAKQFVPLAPPQPRFLKGFRRSIFRF